MTFVVKPNKGTASVLVSSLALTANLIGKNTSSAAFVYGAMSLTDKIANGIAVIVSKYFSPKIMRIELKFLNLSKIHGNVLIHANQSKCSFVLFKYQRNILK